MNLIVVESPTKARTLSRFLGSSYIVEATMGHIKDLPKSDLAVDVENNFEPNYVAVEKKAATIKSLIASAKKANQIYLATDPDREGEAIAQHVKDVIGNGKSKRIVFHEITQSAVEEAIKNPRDVDKNLVDAQIARRVLDRLVGYKLSPLLWKKVRRGLSAGRVQSVAVRLIVEKEREIESFKPVEYWEIVAEVRSKKSGVGKKSFVVRLTKINDKKAEVKNKEEAGKAVTDLEKSDYKILDVKKREVKKSPYPPFTTSTMSQAGARLFGWPVKRTMRIAQKLYEEGLITYHRTDSTNIASQALDMVRAFIEENHGEKYLPGSARFYKVKSKLAQEAHEAIRPTNVSQISNENFHAAEGEFGREHQKLYDLIWRRFVACQMTECVFDETVIDVEAKGRHPERGHSAELSRSPMRVEGSNNQYLLRASGQVLKFDGWRKVIPLAKDEEPELPLVDMDEALDLIKVRSEQKFTQPPARYNEASLIKTLEKLGIGRPSTYAPIITTIQVRQYVEKDEGKFTPTSIGTAVNDFLVANFADIFDYSFTAGMEGDLDNIANGKRDWQKMMKEFYSPFEKKLVDVEEKAKRVKIEAEKIGRKCPECKEGDLVVRVGRFGKFISCSRFPECKYKEKYVEKLGMKCPECGKGDVIIKTTKAHKKFFGCSRFPECKWASWRKPQVPG